MGGKSVSDILEYHGNQVHAGIGHAAYHRALGKRGNAPLTLVQLSETDGKWVGETTIKFERLNGRTGCLVRVIDDTDTAYYSILEESIKPCVHKLVTETEYLIKDVGDEYDESFEYDDDDKHGIASLVTSPNHQPQTAEFGTTD